MKKFAEQFDVAPGYEDLFDLSHEEQDEHEAHMVSLRILSEVQKALDARKMTRKQLAETLGTSASYLTQLFRADKLLNLEMIVKLERVLGLKCQIRFAGAEVGAYRTEELVEKARALHPYRHDAPISRIPAIDWSGGSLASAKDNPLPFNQREKRMAGSYAELQAA
jgi:transcriptional regulator with XRE-family HTH domain